MTIDWRELKNKIYYLDGSLRDIYIHGTTRDDWQKWVDFVNENYKISVRADHLNSKEIIDFARIIDYWNGDQENYSTATVHIDNININCHFFCEEEIENDVSPKEINSIEDHNKLMSYMTKLSKLLNKVVILTPENTPEIILFSVGQKK